MKKATLIKAIVIIVPVLVALYAGYYEQKQEQKLTDSFYEKHNVENTVQVAAN